MGLRVDRLLVVEDDLRLQRSLREALAPHAEELRCCGSVADASQLIVAWRPEVVVLDVVLPDGDALELIRGIPDSVPMPAFLAMSGEATRRQMIRLGELGIHTYLEKPFDLGQVTAALQQAIRQAPDLSRTLRATVGRRRLGDVESEVRHTMVQEALSRSAGSTRGAARLLAVSRQVLQHFLRRISA